MKAFKILPISLIFKVVLLNFRKLVIYQEILKRLIFLDDKNSQKCDSLCKNFGDLQELSQAPKNSVCTKLGLK